MMPGTSPGCSHRQEWKIFIPVQNPRQASGVYINRGAGLSFSDGEMATICRTCETDGTALGAVRQGHIPGEIEDRRHTYKNSVSWSLQENILDVQSR